MSAAGGAFASGLGQGLIQLGTNYQQINQQDVENRAEAIKMRRLESMESDKQSREGLYQSMTLGMQEQQMAAESDRFTATQGLATKQHDLAVTAQTATEAHQTDTLKVQRETLAVTKTAKEAATALSIAELEALEKHRKSTLSLAEKEFEQRKAMDKIDADIATGNYERAGKRWETEKEWYEKEFKQKLSEWKWDKSFKEGSFEQQKFQFTQNYRLKQRELKVVEARLDHEKLDSGERIKLEKKRVKIQSRLAELSLREVEISEFKALNDATYRAAVLDIDKTRVNYEGRKVSIAEAKQKFDEAKGKTEQQRKQFKFTSQDEWGRVKTTEAVVGANGTVITPAEYSYQKIGEKVVAVNLDSIGDVRILVKGQWQNGAQGMATDIQLAFESIAKIAEKQGISIDEAYTKLKESEAGKGLDWGAIDSVYAMRSKVPTDAAIPPPTDAQVTTPGHSSTAVTTNGQPVSIAAAKPGIITQTPTDVDVAADAESGSAGATQEAILKDRENQSAPLTDLSEVPLAERIQLAIMDEPVGVGEKGEAIPAVKINPGNMADDQLLAYRDLLVKLYTEAKLADSKASSNIAGQSARRVPPEVMLALMKKWLEVNSAIDSRGLN